MVRQIVLIFILSSLYYTSIFSQNPPNDLLIKYLITGSYNTFKLDNSGGAIQWQESDDMGVWIDIPGQTYDSIVYLVSTNKYIRAQEVYNNCNPYYSDTIHIIAVNDIGCTQFATDTDGNTYSTIQIGNQCWMAENLKTTHYASGILIPNVTKIVDWVALFDNNTDDAYCYHHNSTANGNIYGALYTWAAALGDNAVSSDSYPSGIQGACPTGWHLPSDNEWKLLEMQLGMSQSEADHFYWRGTDQGSQLAGNSSLWINGNLENNVSFGTSGFTALPGGKRYDYNGSFLSLGWEGNWWSSTETNGSLALFRSISKSNSEMFRGNNYKSSGLSVRCLKDRNIILPYVSTNPLYSITQNTAISGGEITDDGGSAIMARGVCWNTTGNPNITDNITTDGSGSGVFISYMTALTANTTYFVKAYATNNLGTSYGVEEIFTTLITFTCGNQFADYDGNNYNTVQIGSQCWMAENLKTSHYASGTTIPNITANVAWSALGNNNTDDAFCNYNNNANGEEVTYGALYSWAAAMGDNALSSSSIPSGVMGACPIGWHLPSDNEWKQLEMQLGMSQVEADQTGMRGINVGSKLAGDTSLWNSGSLENNAAFGLSGFTALPGGNRNDGNGFFGPLGEGGYWWSSTEYSTSGSWIRGINYYDSGVNRNYGAKSAGFSVRCLNDSSSTQTTLPTVITTTLSAIIETTGTGGGEITDDGGAAILARGVCWNTTGNPSINNNLTVDGTGQGFFISNLTGLTATTTYYVKAYATNILGTAYGAEETFTTIAATTFICGNLFTDYDNNTYNSVQIGTQCWMAENLKTTHYASGTLVPNVTSNFAWDALGDNNTDDAYCYYDNSATNANIYGALYTWAAAMGDNAVSSNSNPSGVQGACPTGWHLPSDNEWKQLEMHLGMSQAEADQDGYRGTNQGSQLAGNSSLWNSGSLENNANFGTSGFTALPGGFRLSTNGSFSNFLGSSGFWWSSTEFSNLSSWYRLLDLDHSEAYRNKFDKSRGYSVRCLKD